MFDLEPIDDRVYVLGPVGIWPFKYRVKLIDHKQWDTKDSDWKIILQRRSVADYQTWTDVKEDTLYENGAEYENRTKQPK